MLCCILNNDLNKTLSMKMLTPMCDSFLDERWNLGLLDIRLLLKEWGWTEYKDLSAYLWCLHFGYRCLFGLERDDLLICCALVSSPFEKIEKSYVRFFNVSILNILNTNTLKYCLTKCSYPRIIWTKSFHSYIEYKDGGRTFWCSGGMLFTLLERSVSFKASWRRLMIRVFEEALDNSIDESDTNNWHKNRLTQSSPKASAVNTSWFSKKKWIDQLYWINKNW